MKAIVHIGTEKTGTTSIQSFLYQNRYKLLEEGFHFLQCAGITNNRALPSYCLNNDREDEFYRNLGITTLEARVAHKQEFIKAFEAELAGLPSTVRAVIMSSEHFHSRIRTAQEMENVHTLMTTYFSEVEIVCYLRDQVTTCTSHYSTALKSGNPSSFVEFTEHCTPGNHYYNYLDMLQKWERCFGFDALNVSLFSAEHFLNGSLLDDFTAKIDPELVGALNTDVQIENESLNLSGQALMRAVNLAFPFRTIRPALEPLREACHGYVSERYSGKGRQLSADSQRALFEPFADVNESLRLKFFPDQEAILQPPPASDNPASIAATEFLEGFLGLLDIIRSAGPEVLEEGEELGIYNILFSIMNELLYKHGETKLVQRLSADERSRVQQLGLEFEARGVPAAMLLRKIVYRDG